MKIAFYARRMVGVSLGIVFAWAWPAAAEPAARGQAEHVVILIWDGMRRDFVTPQYTPNLYAMAREGVFFKRHHAAYVSSTEVNGTAIATGVYPNRSGILANNDYRPELSFMDNLPTQGLDNLRRADLLTGGHYLLMPTLAEILQGAGFSTLVAGSKPVAVLLDRSARRVTLAQTNSVMLFAGQTIPKSLIKLGEKANDDKKFGGTGAEKDTWTTKALLNGLWKKGVPKCTYLWLCEPDASQHSDGVGSDPALAGIAHSDRKLEEVLHALDERKLRDKTDVIVTSDHGFSNVKRGPDVVEALKKAKFKAVRKFEDPEPGEILVVGLGGSTSFYVVDHEEALVRKLVEFLQGADFTGVIFTRTAMEGTFPMDAARINTTNVRPDVVISMRWLDERDEHGTPGLVYADGGTRGKGTHGSLSRYDMGNTLVARGPDFRQGLVSETPSGGVDLAPTVLWILGVTPPQPMDGRVLTEALKGETPPPPVETKILEASRDLGWFHWHQYLKYSRVGDTPYFDEGNGGVEVR